MMHGIRNLLWLAPLLFLLAWPLYGGPVRSFLAPPEIREHDPGDWTEGVTHRFVLEGVRLYQDLAGIRRLKIDTPLLRTDKEGEALLLGEISGVFFQEDERRLFFAADRGRYDSADGILYLEDNVRLREAERFMLTTPALTYHEREGKVSSRSGVELITEEVVVRGRNLDYDLAAGTYLLTGDVRFIAR